MILDIILVVLFLLLMLYGYKKGLIAIVAKLVSLLLAFVLAYFLGEMVGSYIAKTNFGINIQQSIETTVLNYLNKQSNSEETEYIEEQGELENLENSEIEKNTDKQTEISIIQDKLGFQSQETFVPKIVAYVFTGMGFVIVFITTRIILWIVQKILESIFELPLLKAFNKLGGVAASAVLYIIEISIILAIIKCVSALAFMNGVINVINSSVITKALYDHNIATNIILSKII